MSSQPNGNLVRRFGGPVTVAVFGIMLAGLIFLGQRALAEGRERAEADKDRTDLLNEVVGLTKSLRAQGMNLARIEGQAHECEGSAADITHRLGDPGYEDPHIHECHDRQQKQLADALALVDAQHSAQTRTLESARANIREQDELLVTIAQDTQTGRIVEIRPVGPGEKVPPPGPGEVTCLLRSVGVKLILDVCVAP